MDPDWFEGDTDVTAACRWCVCAVRSVLGHVRGENVRMPYFMSFLLCSWMSDTAGFVVHRCSPDNRMNHNTNRSPMEIQGHIKQTSAALAIQAKN